MLVFHRTPIDETLCVWLDNFPESFHPLDLDRFYIFVKTKIRYARSKKWDSLDFFTKKVRAINPKLEIQVIEKYFHMMQDFTAFEKKGYLGTITMTSDPDDKYIEVRMVNGHRVEKEIDKKRFLGFR